MVNVYMRSGKTMMGGQTVEVKNGINISACVLASGGHVAV